MFSLLASELYACRVTDKQRWTRHKTSVSTWSLSDSCSIRLNWSSFSTSRSICRRWCTSSALYGVTRDTTASQDASSSCYRRSAICSLKRSDAGRLSLTE